MVEGLQDAWYGELGILTGLWWLLRGVNKKRRKRRSLGDMSGEGTPGPIPNPAVKLASADGTWGATPWESRSLPRDLFLFGVCA